MYVEGTNSTITTGSSKLYINSVNVQNAVREGIRARYGFTDESMVEAKLSQVNRLVEKSSAREVLEKRDQIMKYGFGLDIFLFTSEYIRSMNPYDQDDAVSISFDRKYYDCNRLWTRLEGRGRGGDNEENGGNRKGKDLRVVRTEVVFYVDLFVKIARMYKNIRKGIRDVKVRQFYDQYMNLYRFILIRKTRKVGGVPGCPSEKGKRTDGNSMITFELDEQVWRILNEVMDVESEVEKIQVLMDCEGNKDKDIFHVILIIKYWDLLLYMWMIHDYCEHMNDI